MIVEFSASDLVHYNLPPTLSTKAHTYIYLPKANGPVRKTMKKYSITYSNNSNSRGT